MWRYGHEPTLIEQAPRLRTGGYIVDFWGSGYAVAERMGLTEQLHAIGYAVQELRPVERNLRKVGGLSTEVFRRSLDGRFVTVPRGDLAAMIYSLTDDQVEVQFGESVSPITQHSSGVQVTLDHGQSRRFDLLIGAGGIHSPVRDLLFGCESRFETDLGYRVAAFEAEGYQPRDELVYLAYTTPGRTIRDERRKDAISFRFLYWAHAWLRSTECVAGQDYAASNLW